MERRLPLLPGRRYHLVMCGNNGDPIFRNHQDYEAFLDRYVLHCAPVLETFDFNFLGNHAHFAVETRIDRIDLGTGRALAPLTERNINRALSNFLNAYAKHFNCVHKRRGSLFETSFWRGLVDDDDYLQRLIRYIDYNAVHHGFVNNPFSWPYSSLHSFGPRELGWLNRDAVYDIFGGEAVYRRRTSAEFDKYEFNDLMVLDPEDFTDIGGVRLLKRNRWPV